MRKINRLVVGALLVWAYFASLPEHVWKPAPVFFVPETVDEVPAPGDQWQFFSASDLHTRLVHAASMAPLDNGRVRAFWFAGSREGAADVGIHSAVFDPARPGWSKARRIIHREQVERALGRPIRKLGNAVPVETDDGLRLYFVAVSMGGWGGSRLAVAEPGEPGADWRVTGELVTSPLVNISTLVKGAPFRFADGSLGLPVYHEFLGKFGEVLRLSESGRLLEKQRIGHGREAIQPVVFISSPVEATAVLRNESESRPGPLFASHTDNRGEQWSPLMDSGLPNPGSAVGGISLGPRHWLLGANDNAEERDTLAVLDSRDAGKSWRTLRRFHDRAEYREGHVPLETWLALMRDDLGRFREAPAQEDVLAAAQANKCTRRGCSFQFDYPYVLRADNGDIHVVYTWNKTLIGHAWWRAGEAER